MTDTANAATDQTRRPRKATSTSGHVTPWQRISHVARSLIAYSVPR